MNTKNTFFQRMPFIGLKRKTNKINNPQTRLACLFVEYYSRKQPISFQKLSVLGPCIAFVGPCLGFSYAKSLQGSTKAKSLQGSSLQCFALHSNTSMLSFQRETSMQKSFALHKKGGKPNKKTLNCQAYEAFSRNEKTLKSNNSKTPMEKSFYWNQCFDKGRLKNFVLWFLRNNGEHRTIKLVEELKNLGFQYATKAGISLGIEDLKIPSKKTSLLFLAEKETAVTIKQYKRGDITGVERFQRLINTWHQTSEQLKQEVIDNFEATDILNPVYMMAFSGARGNISQVRQLVGMRGLMSNPQGQIIDFPIRSNFREGLTLTEYIISSYGARKGIVDTALRTANAGYLTRRLVDVAQHVIISNFDCGTRRGIFLKDMKEGNKTILSLSTRLVGRVCATDIYTNSGINSISESLSFLSFQRETSMQKSFAFLHKGVAKQALHKNLPMQNEPTHKKIAKRNDEISLDLSYEISKVTKKVFVRSALTCETKKLVCQLCYGWSLAQGNLVSIGEAIGVIAAQSIGEPGTQLTMRTFHTGGVFSGDVSDLIKMPFKGIIFYASPIPGTLIRTPEGKIAFLTKSEGSFTISKISELIEKDMCNTLNSLQQEGKGLTLKQFQSKLPLSYQKAMQTKKLKIPPYTILYAKNGEVLKEKEMVAQITTINLQKTATDTAEITIKSELEGELHINYLDLKENKVGPKLTKKEKEKKVFRSNTSKKSFLVKENTFNNVQNSKINNIVLQSNTFNKKQSLKGSTNLMSTVFEAWKWGNAWILSGKIYHAGKPTQFFPEFGDFLKEKSVITGPHSLHSTSIVSGNLKLDSSKKVEPKYALPILLKNSLSTNVCNSPRSNGLQSNPSNNKQSFLLKKFNKNHVFDDKQSFLLKNNEKENEPLVKNVFLSFSLTKISYKKFGYFVKLNDSSSYNFPFNKKLNFSLEPFQILTNQKAILSVAKQHFYCKCYKVTLNSKGTIKKNEFSNTFVNVQNLSIKNEFLTTKDPIFIIPPNLEVLLNKSYKTLYPSNWQPKFNFVLQWFPTRFQTKTAGFFVIENIKDVKNRKLDKLLPKSSKPSTGKATHLFQGVAKQALHQNLFQTNKKVKKNHNLGSKSKKQSLHGLNKSLTIEKNSIRQGPNTLRNEKLLCLNQHKKLIKLPMQHSLCITGVVKGKASSALQVLASQHLEPTLKPTFFNIYNVQSNKSVLGPCIAFSKAKSLQGSTMQSNALHKIENQQKKRITFLRNSLGSQAINQKGKLEHSNIKKISRILWIPDSINNSKKPVSIQSSFQTSTLSPVLSFESVEQVKHSLNRKSGTRRKLLFQKTHYKAATNLKSFCYFFSSTLLETNKVGQSPAWKVLHSNTSNTTQSLVLKQKTHSFINYSKNLHKEDTKVIHKNFQKKNGWYYFIFNNLNKSSPLSHSQGVLDQALQKTNKETQNKENHFSSNNSEDFFRHTQTNSFPFYPGQAILSNIRVDNHIVNVSLLDLNKNKEEPVDFSYFSKNNLNFEFWVENPKCRYKNTNLYCNLINKHKKHSKQSQSKTHFAFQVVEHKHLESSITSVVCPPAPTLSAKKRNKSLVLESLHSYYNNGNNLGEKKTTTIKSEPSSKENKTQKVLKINTPNKNRNSLLKFSIQKVEEFPLYLKNPKDFLNLKTEIYEISNSSNNPLNGLTINKTFYKKSLFSNVLKRSKFQNTKVDYPFYKVKTGNQKLSLYALLYNRKVAPIAFSIGITKKSLPLLIEKNNGYFWGPNKSIEEINTFYANCYSNLHRSLAKQDLDFFDKLSTKTKLNFVLQSKASNKKQSFLLKDFWYHSQKGQGQFLNGGIFTRMKKHFLCEFWINKKSLKRKKEKEIVFNKSFLSLKLVHDFKSAQLNKQSISPQLLSKYPNVDIQILGELSIPISQNNKILQYKDSLSSHFSNNSNSLLIPLNRNAMSSFLSEYVPNPQNFFTFWITVPSNDPTKVFRSNTSYKKTSFLLNGNSKKENLSVDKPSLLMQSSICNGLFDYPFKDYIFDFCPTLQYSKLLALRKARQSPIMKSLQKLPLPCFNSSLTYSLDSLFSKKNNTCSAVKFYLNDQNIVSPLVPFAKTFSYSPFEGEIVQINSQYSFLSLAKQDFYANCYSNSNLNKSVLGPCIAFSKAKSLQGSAKQSKALHIMDNMSNIIQKEPNTSLIIQKKDLISFYFKKKKQKSDVNILSHSIKIKQETNIPNFYIIKNMLVPMSPEIANENSNSNNSNSHNKNKEESNINNELQFFKIPQIMGGFPNFKAGYSFHKKNKNKKSLTFQKTIETQFFIGDFVVMGDTISSLKKEKEKNYDNKQNLNPLAVTKSGQIIHISQEKITIRKGQPLFISPKAILHKFNGDFIESQSPVITLSYQRLKTGDIVQGIPKIEQFFEARTTKRGRLFRDSLPNLLNALFRRYLQKLPLEKAVRQSFYKIQQIIVDGVLRVYRSQGVTIADKHLEIIVKQMTSKVRIIEGGQTGFFPGEVVDLDFVEQVNDLLMKKIQYEPLVLGITKSSLEVDSFLSAASFQQTTRVLSLAAISRKKDFLKGLKENVILGNLIPAGTGYLVYLDDIYKQSASSPFKFK